LAKRGKFRLLAKIKYSLNGLKLRQKLLLIYFIGCLVPMTLMYFYLYNGSKTALIEQAIDNDTERLDVQANSISKSIRLISELSDNFTFDTRSEKIYLQNYAEMSDILSGYQGFGETMDYISERYKDVYGICFYFYDQNINVDNRYFKYLSKTIMTKEWYIDTVDAAGAPHLTYYTQIQTGDRGIRITRLLYSRETPRKCVGIVSIKLPLELTNDFLDTSELNSMIILNEKELVTANFDVSDELMEAVVNTVQSGKYSGWITFEGEEYVVASSSVGIYSSEENYRLLTLRPKSDIISNAKKNAVSGMGPMVVCVLFTTIAIVLLANSFSKRIGSFSKVMHKAAEGDFDTQNFEIGKSRDEIYDLNNDLNSMIRDIKRLMEKENEARLQKEQIYSRQKDVELKMLASQINPHFLYNTLENIRMLSTLGEAEAIDEITVNLTRFLRRTLNVGNTLRTLAWEMEMIESYIAIQNYRFGDRITASVEYNKEDADKYLLVPFVLQPFVENAYVHAMEEKEADGLIKVRARVDKEKSCLRLSIEDNGHGMDEEELKNVTRFLNDFEHLDRDHIGICNVNQRIKLTFGEEYGVVFDSIKDVGTNVNIKLPLIYAEKSTAESTKTPTGLLF